MIKFNYILTQCFVGFYLFFFSFFAFAQQIYTIELQHRSSEEIINAIEPLLPSHTKIQTFDNKLILNTSANNYSRIKDVIDTLDVPAVQLRIKLYNGNVTPSNSASISENKYELGTSSLEKDNRYVRSTSREDNRKTDELLVMSGEMAILETQVTLPLLNSQYAYRDRSSSSNQYADALNSQSTKNKFELPATTGVNIKIPTAEQLAPGQTVISVQNPAPPPPPGQPVPVTPPVVVPNVPGQNFKIENEQSTTQSQALDNYQYQADRGASEQFYQYHQLDSGLMIRPIYIKGSNKVLLEFLTKSTHIDKQNQMNDKAYSQYKVGSKMMLPMNKWVYVGGNRIDKPSAQKYEYRTQAREKKNQHLWVYIETN